jgi:LPS-assembly protein
MRWGVALCLGSLLAVAPLPAVAQLSQRGTHAQAPVLFSANEVQYDEELGLLVAKGNVELSQGDQILLADVVTYNQRTDTATASGHVSLLQPSGDILFGDFIELHDDMRDGFVKNVRMLLSDRSRIAANTARRVAGTRTELRRAVYSPCEPCREDPTRAPEWQIKAEEMVHDKELQLIEYRDALLEVGGLPILWTPYFSHPDPSVKRRSGFLPPHFGNSNANGFSVGIPYYAVLGPDKDATIQPLFTSSGGTLVAGEYRQYFGDGRITSDDSVTVGSRRSTLIDTTLRSGLRWHTNTTGEFDLSENWRIAGAIERASDQTYLLRYHLPTPVNFLTSHLFGEYFGRRSYGNISGWGFQSLQGGVHDSAQPFLLPVADYQWTSEPGLAGSRLSLEGNAMDLFRIQGVNTRRLSLGSEWRLPFRDGLGSQYDFTLALRSDGYQSNNLPLGALGAPVPNTTAGRVFPQLALSWRMPFIRRSEGYSELIEPVAMLAAAPRGGNPLTIPNEDSQGFEFDETSLFLRNRFPGFDRVDSGQRVDYGLRGGIYGDGGGSTRFLVGQSYAAERNNDFAPGSGLTSRRSDVVGRITVTPVPLFDATYRFRLDGHDLALRRQEASVAVGPSNLRTSVSYLQIEQLADSTTLSKRKQVTATISTGLTRYWTATISGTRDFSPVPGTTLGQIVGTTEAIGTALALTYRDDCMAFITQLSQSGIRNGDVTPGTSIVATIVFKNLGDIGTSLGNIGGAGLGF